ncbi:MAG: nuclear transport factor 2 family protein [Polyangiaceae bacterium]
MKRDKLVLLAVLGLAACNKSSQSRTDTHTKTGFAELDCERDAGAATSANGEREAVASAVRLYFQGHATGDGNYHRQAFHPEARLFWVKSGALSQKTSAEFAAGATGKPAADEARRERRIAAIDVAGDAAMAKVELTYPDVHFVDYLSLLKIDGRWTIVNKIFHREDVGPSAMR